MADFKTDPGGKAGVCKCVSVQEEEQMDVAEAHAGGRRKSHSVWGVSGMTLGTFDLITHSSSHTAL